MKRTAPSRDVVGSICAAVLPSPSMKPNVHDRILVGLRQTGPSTIGQLASNLSEPFGVVLFALEKLRDVDRHIRVLPGGLWDVTDDYKSK